MTSSLTNVRPPLSAAAPLPAISTWVAFGLVLGPVGRAIQATCTFDA